MSGGFAKWLGRKVMTFPVLFVEFELDVDEQHRRAYQVARGMLLEKPPDDLLYVSGTGRTPGRSCAPASAFARTVPGQAYGRGNRQDHEQHGQDEGRAEPTSLESVQRTSRLDPMADPSIGGKAPHQTQWQYFDDSTGAASGFLPGSGVRGRPAHTSTRGIESTQSIN